MPVREIYICTILAIVLTAGFVTDFIGIHAMFGAFVVGGNHKKCCRGNGDSGGAEKLQSVSHWPNTGYQSNVWLDQNWVSRVQSSRDFVG